MQASAIAPAPRAATRVWYCLAVLPVTMLVLAFLFQGYEAFGPAAGIASIILFASIVILVLNVWRDSDS